MNLLFSCIYKEIYIHFRKIINYLKFNSNFRKLYKIEPMINKVILLILLTMFTFEVNAQKISVDRIENDGKHQIMTKSKEYSIDGAKYSFCIKVYESSSGKDWLLVVSSYIYIPSSSEILLKLGNDEVLYLPVNNVRVAKVTMPGYGYNIGSITTFSPSTEVNYYTSVYVLSDIKMDKMDAHGITKIRISDGSKYRDETFSTNTFGRFLTKCRRNIVKRLNEPIQQKGLFEDF